MLDLVAIGPETGQRWRRQLARDVTVRLGRTPRDGWDVPWDLRVSREHADLRLVGDKLQIRCLQTATNAVYHRGEPFREVVIDVGDDFRIGETTFRFEKVPDDVAAKVAPLAESPTQLDPSETNVISDLHDTDIAKLEASLARFEAEAQQATELADRRFAEIQELRKEIDTLRASKPADNDNGKQAEEEIRKAKLLAKERSAEVTQLKADVARLHKENELLNRKLAAAAEKADSEKGVTKQVNSQIAELRTRNEQLQSEVADLTKQRDLLEARFSEADQRTQSESEQHARQIAQLREETETIQRNLAEVSKQRDSLTQRAAELESNLTAETEKLQAAEAERAEAQAELQQVKERANALDSKISQHEIEQSNLSHSLRDVVGRLQREKDAVAELNSEREQLKSETDSLTSRILAGENSLRAAQQEVKQLSRQVEERRQQIEALQEAVSALRGHLEEKNNELRAAQIAAREKTDAAAKLHAEVASLTIDVESLSEHIQNREASLEIVRLENREQADEIRQLRRLNEGAQDEAESLRSQLRSHSDRLRKAEYQAQHEAQEAQRFKEQNESLLDELIELKRKLEGSSLERIESIALTRKPSKGSAKRPSPPPQKPRPGGTDETIDEQVARNSNAGPELKQFGQYRILEKVGQGGMGAVYKAVHMRLDKVVALKLLNESRAHSSDRAARFDREMKAIGRLDHENLVRAIDAGESDETLYLVMEFVDGLDVSDLLGMIGQLSLADACEIVRQAAIGMDYVHRRKLVHRDLKPSNLMLTRNGRVKILDLGLAQLNDWGGEGLTQSGQIMGTLDYMAPEQAGDSRLVDHRADIYSLGCAFYEMLSGRSPFGRRGNETFAELILAHATHPLPPLAALRPDVPSQLVQLMDQMTAKQPQDRPQAMQEIAQRLETLSRDASLSSLLATAASRGRGTRTTTWQKREVEGGEKSDTAGEAMMGTRTNSSQIANESTPPSKDAPQTQKPESEHLGEQA